MKKNGVAINLQSVILVGNSSKYDEMNILQCGKLSCALSVKLNEIDCGVPNEQMYTLKSPQKERKFSVVSCS